MIKHSWSMIGILTALLLVTLTSTNGRSLSGDIAIINPQVGHSVITADAANPSANVAGTSNPCVTTDGALVTSETQPDHYDHLNANHKQEGIKRYRVAAIEFARVETPFIIALWILCASLAKIGEET